MTPARSCIVLLITLATLACSRQPEFPSFPKIDAHVHLETYDEAFVDILRENNMQLITLVTRSLSQSLIEEEYSFARYLHQNHPGHIGFATTISMDGFGEPGWNERTLDWLEKCKNEGAVALKLWKDIGMTFRDSSGTFILIDDPRLDPVYDYVESSGLTLVNHNAEPLNCWLPLDEMTVRGDSSYFARNPQYHMYLHPDYPSHEALIAARDRMLEKHPHLIYVGCHLGSQEYDVDVLAQALDRFPHMSLDMAARISHFKVQDREKVRRFLIDYQDRLLYGTDVAIRGEGEPGWNAKQARRILEDTWLRDWEYFTSDKVFTQNDKVKQYRGLDLPIEVLEKIYYENAARLYSMTP